MPNILKRKILRVGDALGITLPKSIVDSYGLEKGADIFIITDAVDEKFLFVDLGKRNIVELRSIMNM